MDRPWCPKPIEIDPRREPRRLERGKTSNRYIADPWNLVNQPGKLARTFVPALFRMDSRALSWAAPISSFSALAWACHPEVHGSDLNTAHSLESVVPPSIHVG